MSIVSKAVTRGPAALLATTLLHCGPAATPKPPADGAQAKPSDTFLPNVRAVAAAKAFAAARAGVRAQAAQNVESARAQVARAAGNQLAEADLKFAVAKLAWAAADAQMASDAEVLAEKQSALDAADTASIPAAKAALVSATEHVGASAGTAKATAEDLVTVATERASVTAAWAAGQADNAVLIAANADVASAKDVAAKTKENTAGGATTPGAASPPPTGATPDQQTQVEFATGARLRYGLNISLFEFNVKRPSNQPGRLRDYEPNLQLVPPQIGFQFTYEPPQNPWRQKKSDGTYFQLISAGGMLLIQIDNASLAQGAIALGGTLNFFANVLGIGLAVDLYRGVPTLGPNGVAGATTASTGLLAWALSPRGEVTPEDVSLVLTFGLEPIVSALSGVLK